MGKKQDKKIDGNFSVQALEQFELLALRLADELPSVDPVGFWAGYAVECAENETVLIEALSKVRRPEVATFLFFLSQNISDKKLAKAAKRALYRLEQAGIKADRSGWRQAPLIGHASPARISLGFLGMYDMRGDRPGLLAIPKKSGGYDIALAYINQSIGMVNFEAWHASSTSLERMAQSIRDQSDMRSIPVPPEAVWFAIREAFDQARRFGEAEFEGFTAFVSVAGQVPVLKRPLIYDLIDEQTVRAEAEFRLERLVQHEFLAGFLPFKEIEPYIPKVMEVDSSILVLSRTQKQARIADILDQAAGVIFTDKRVGVLKRQLEETALLFWETDQRDLAETALSAAVNLDREWAAKSPPEFIRALLGETLNKLREEEPEHTPEQRTPAGLILPE